jgi:hypothetical protein
MKSQTFDYNPNYLPAAPFAELIVHHEDDNLEPINITAQIDTGIVG